MPIFPTFNGILVNGTVGTLSELGETSAPVTAVNPGIRVFLSGKGVSGAIGLDEDLRLLVQGFIQRSHSREEKTSPDTPVSERDGKINIALHGLNLAPGEERELHHLIRELVHKRVAGKETIK